jgi:glutamate--cysteine ligase catalytic subunit
MQNAQKRNACLEQKFYFRRNISTGTSNESNKSQDECELVEMTINEIVNGSDHFPGCIQLILDYLSNLDVDVETQCTIKQYLKLVETRANGTKITAAAFIRKFVESHPKYNQDSRINDEINYDLMWRIYLISSGQIKCPELFNYF